MEGKNAERVAGNPRIRNTCSKRTQCKAGMKLKKIYDDAKDNVISVQIDLVNYEHNHEFLKKDTEKGQLQCNKTHDREYMEFLSAMQESRIPQHCIMDLLQKCMVA
jgi:predicted class III extradiol MEMO1 family dioxygenase